MNTIRIILNASCSAIFIMMAGMLVAPTIGAQDLNLPYGVTDRVAPETDAAGIRLGGFTAYPKLGMSTGYDDNILAQKNNERDDVRFNIDPSLAYESNWSQHQLSLGGFVSSALYTDHTSQDNLNWGVGGSGQLDVLRSSNIQASLGYEHLTEDRGGISAATIDDPVDYHRLQAGAVGNHRFNQLTLSVGGQFEQLEYDNQGQQYRDREVWTATVQGGYEFSPGYSGFVRGVFNGRNFDNLSITPGNPSQDSTGYRVALGVASELTRLISGEVYVGYLDQDYSNSAFSDVSGVSFGADLNWEVTQMTAIRVSASRDVVDSTTAGTGGILYSTAGIGIDHQLTPDVSLKGDFSYYDGDFEGTSRNDDGLRASSQIEYRLSRMVHLDLRYELDDRDSNAAGRSYTRHQVIFGVHLQI